MNGNKNSPRIGRKKEKTTNKKEREIGLYRVSETALITNRRQLQMAQKHVDELRQKYIKNPPEGMTPKLVKDMTDSDLLDMHYFLTEDDDLDDDGWEEGFYIDLF